MLLLNIVDDLWIIIFHIKGDMTGKLNQDKWDLEKWMY